MTTAMVGGGDDIYVDHARLGTTQTVTSDYELDFEYHFEFVDFDDVSGEQLNIYVQTASQNGEFLTVEEWDGATWQAVGTLSSDGLNTFDINYLTDTDYYIRLTDSDQSNEGTQSTWSKEWIFQQMKSSSSKKFTQKFQVYPSYNSWFAFFL